MPDQVGGVLLVVAHERGDRVLVEALDLLGVRGQHAEQQPVGAAADLLAGRAAAGGLHAEHQLGLLQRAAHVGGVGVDGRRRRPAPGAPAGPPPCGRPPPRRAAARRRGRPRSARGRPGARRRSRRAGGPARARRGRRTCRRRPRTRSQPEAGGAAHDVARVEVVAREQLLEEGAAKVLLGLVAGLGHRDLGERGDRRDVQVLAGVGAALAEQQHGARAPGRRTRSAPRRSPRRAARACRRPAAWPRSARAAPTPRRARRAAARSPPPGRRRGWPRSPRRARARPRPERRPPSRGGRRAGTGGIRVLSSMP